MMRHASSSTKPFRGTAWLLGVGLLLVVACKDKEPCDEGQESVGTSCLPEVVEGTGGQPAEPAPTAEFGDACQTDDDCGGPAPICATDPLFYCSQIECQEGEENEGSCPEGWRCFKYLDNPSACVNF